MCGQGLGLYSKFWCLYVKAPRSFMLRTFSLVSQSLGPVKFSTNRPKLHRAGHEGGKGDIS